MNEIWKDIPGYEKLYRVSYFGVIESYPRNTTKGKILKPSKQPSGHLSVVLHKNGKRSKQYYIHRLVLEAFVGPCPLGMECRHLDGNPQNNKLKNLCWGTRKENRKDSKDHGTFYGYHYKGSQHWMAKLNDWKVRVINRLLEDGFLTQKEIAEIFKVSEMAISDIKNHKTWNYVIEK